MTRHRLIFAALVLAAVAMAAPAGTASAQGAPRPAPAVESSRPGAASAAEAGHEARGHEARGDEHGEGHAGGWGATIAKAVNFAILAGVLVYFLRAPLTGYLNGRIGRVREDLVSAAQMRQAAQRQLAEIEARLKGLPAEIEALKQRGAEDIVAERSRIERAAEAERQRLLEHTRREIEMRLRVATRELLELGANLAVGVAADRVQRSITADDQGRLVDRYAAQLAGTARGAQS